MQIVDLFANELKRQLDKSDIQYEFMSEMEDRAILTDAVVIYAMYDRFCIYDRGSRSLFLSLLYPELENPDTDVIKFIGGIVQEIRNYDVHIRKYHKKVSQ